MSTVLTHAGLEHDYPRRTLRSVWEKAASKLDVSPTAHKYICEIIELTSNQDYQPDSICAIFYGVPKLSPKIRMPRRSINRAETELEDKEWIIKTCSKRGRRNGVRDNHGAKQIRWAAGINLGPLIDRFKELQGQGCAIKDIKRSFNIAVDLLRAKISEDTGQSIEEILPIAYTPQCVS